MKETANEFFVRWRNQFVFSTSTQKEVTTELCFFLLCCCRYRSGPAPRSLSTQRVSGSAGPGPGQGEGAGGRGRSA